MDCHPRVQTLIYLMPSVAGHLANFSTRTRGPFWSIRPARILLIAVLGTPGHRHPHRRVRVVHGPTRVEMGARAVGLCALAWLLVSDRIKLLCLPHPPPGKEGQGNLRTRSRRRPDVCLRRIVRWDTTESVDTVQFAGRETNTAQRAVAVASLRQPQRRGQQYDGGFFITPLISSVHRMIVPDDAGFGRSDEPTDPPDRPRPQARRSRHRPLDRQNSHRSSPGPHHARHRIFIRRSAKHHCAGEHWGQPTRESKA